MQISNTKDTSSAGAPTAETRARSLLLGALAVLGPPLLLFVYWKLTFAGLTNADAIDFAQLGRNLAQGRGFITYVLRPLAVNVHLDPLRQPDVTHGPLYPFVLALFFGVLGAKDWVVALASGTFYLLSIPALYLLGKRTFGQWAGILAAAIFATNSLILDYATSGLHITLYVFLATVLMLALFAVADNLQRPAGQVRGLPTAALITSGAATAFLYLTDPVFAWFIPVVLVTVFLVSGQRRWAAMAWFSLPLLMFAVPWMIRNGAVTGNPVFGLRGRELWMGTSAYPGLDAYRMSADRVSAGPGLFRAVLKKVAFGFGDVLEGIPQLPFHWMLFFFLPGLLFQFKSPALNSVRRAAIACLLLLTLGTVLFYVQMTLFVALTPVLLVFAIAYLQHVVSQAKLTRGATGALGAALAVALLYPTFRSSFLIPRGDVLPTQRRAASLNKEMRPDEISISGEPWTAAWYGDRASLWIPAEDDTVLKMVRRQPNDDSVLKVDRLFLGPSTPEFGPIWSQIYQAFSRWNDTYQKEPLGKKPKPVSLAVPKHAPGQVVPPLLEALDGFTVVEPSSEADPRAVVAKAPSAAGSSARSN